MNMPTNTTRRFTWLLLFSLFTLLTCPTGAFATDNIDPSQMLHAAFDNWRGHSSQTEVTMTIHRPGWERSLTMKSWTQGEENSLARFIAPAKDAGNATLKLGKQTYIFNPKLRQVVKLPASLLAQSWMGSDFSYNDLAKADDILVLYSHRVIDQYSVDGVTAYAIEAIPNPEAPVVWGKIVVKVRKDGVLLEQAFYDQDMQLARTMITDRIGTIGGRNYPVVVSMHPVDKENQWTRIETTQGKFDLELPAYLFTRSNLENARE